MTLPGEKKGDSGVCRLVLRPQDLEIESVEFPESSKGFRALGYTRRCLGFAVFGQNHCEQSTVYRAFGRSL